MGGCPFVSSCVFFFTRRFHSSRGLAHLSDFSDFTDQPTPLFRFSNENRGVAEALHNTGTLEHTKSILHQSLEVARLNRGPSLYKVTKRNGNTTGNIGDGKRRCIKVLFDGHLAKKLVFASEGALRTDQNSRTAKNRQHLSNNIKKKTVCIIVTRTLLYKGTRKFRSGLDFICSSLGTSFTLFFRTLKERR